MLQTRIISPPKVTIRDQWIEEIRDRKKTVEGRLYKGFFRNLQRGNRIEFIASNNPHNSILCKVTYTKRYNNFKEMLQVEGFKNFFPTVPSIEKAVTIYNGMPKYSRQVAICGALAIGIEVVL